VRDEPFSPTTAIAGGIAGVDVGDDGWSGLGSRGCRALERHHNQLLNLMSARVVLGPDLPSPGPGGGCCRTQQPERLIEGDPSNLGVLRGEGNVHARQVAGKMSAALPADAVEGKRALGGALGHPASSGPRGRQVDRAHRENPDDLKVQVRGQ
jgi:hypothetical protein